MRNVELTGLRVTNQYIIEFCVTNQFFTGTITLIIIFEFQIKSDYATVSSITDYLLSRNFRPGCLRRPYIAPYRGLPVGRYCSSNALAWLSGE